MNKRGRLVLGIRYGLILAAVALIVYFIFFTETGGKVTHTNVSELSEYLRSFGTYAVVLGMLAVLFQTIIPFVPFVLVAGANVLVFGLGWGFTINYFMSLAGAFIAFLFARYYAREAMERKLARYPVMHAFNKNLEKQGLLYVLFGRLIPVLPSSAINIGSGVTKIRIKDFILGTVLGKMPMILLESLIGHDLVHFHQYRKRLMLLLFIFVLLLAAGSMLKTRLASKPAE